MQLLADVLVAFDLDDTLYKEIDYVDSVFREISHGDTGLYEKLKSAGSHYEAFGSLDEESENIAVELYRSGKVTLADTEGACRTMEFLRSHGAAIAIVTDGWTRRQKEKINRLGLTGLVDYVIVSEELGSDKLSGEAFKMLEKLYPDRKRRFYVGDNPVKDFVRANERGWTTVMVADDGRNIHSQNPEGFSVEMLPQIVVNNLMEAANVVF